MKKLEIAEKEKELTREKEFNKLGHEEKERE